MMRNFLFVSYLIVLTSPCFGSEFASFGFDNHNFTRNSNQNRSSINQSNLMTDSTSKDVDELLNTIKNDIEIGIKNRFGNSFLLFNNTSRDNLENRSNLLNNAVHSNDIILFTTLLNSGLDCNEVRRLLQQKEFDPVDNASPYILKNNRDLVVRTKGKSELPPLGGMNICLYLQVKHNVFHSGQHPIYNNTNELCKVAFLRKYDDKLQAEHWTYRYVPSHKGQIAPKDSIIKHFCGQILVDKYKAISVKERLEIDRGIDAYITGLSHHQFKESSQPNNNSQFSSKHHVYENDSRFKKYNEEFLNMKGKKKADLDRRFGIELDPHEFKVNNKRSNNSGFLIEQKSEFVTIRPMQVVNNNNNNNNEDKDIEGVLKRKLDQDAPDKNKILTKKYKEDVLSMDVIAKENFEGPFAFF